jgi:uncharacterized protein YceK
MRSTGSVLALLVLILSLISGCSCLAAQSYAQPDAKSTTLTGRLTLAKTTKALGRHKVGFGRS